MNNDGYHLFEYVNLYHLTTFIFEEEFLVRLSGGNFCSSNVISGDLIAEMILLFLSCEGEKIRQTNAV